MRDLIIHIGAHKCGSSAIQRTLLNLDPERTGDLHVIRTGRHPNAGAHYNIMHLMMGRLPENRARQVRESRC